jgi:hypothetical protein
MLSPLAIPIAPRPRVTGRWAFMTDEVTGNIGLYDEPAAGDPTDPNSAANAPLNNPAANLQYLYWHIQLDNMEVLSDAVVSITHGAVAVAGVPPSAGVGVTGQYDYAYTPVDTVLVTHSLGYLPMAYVAIGNNLVTPGYIVQMNASGAARYVSVFVTTTQVLLREWAQRGTVALSALSQDYRVMVIREQPAADGSKRLIDWDQVNAILRMGEGRFDSSRRYLQVVPGGTPFGLALGRTLDLANGAPRFVAPSGTIYDPVPASTVMKYVLPGFATSFGASMAYNGSFTGDPVLQVQAP